MNINTYVDTNGNKLKIGQTVKFKTHYGYQGYRTLEGEGIITEINEGCRILLKLDFTYTNGSNEVDWVWIYGTYDSKLVVFGKSKTIIQFDYPTELNEYLIITGIQS